MPESENPTKTVDLAAPHPLMVEFFCRVIFAITSSARSVYLCMGPGLREEHYQRAMGSFIQKMIVPPSPWLHACVDIERNIPVSYQSHDCGLLRADIVVSLTNSRRDWRDDVAVVECKSVVSDGWHVSAMAQAEAYSRRLRTIITSVTNIPPYGGGIPETRLIVGGEVDRLRAKNAKRVEFLGREYSSSKPIGRESMTKPLTDHWCQMVRWSDRLKMHNEHLWSAHPSEQ